MLLFNDQKHYTSYLHKAPIFTNRNKECYHLWLFMQCFWYMKNKVIKSSFSKKIKSLYWHVNIYTEFCFIHVSVCTGFWLIWCLQFNMTSDLIVPCTYSQNRSWFPPSHTNLRVNTLIWSFYCRSSLLLYFSYIKNIAWKVIGDNILYSCW
jgi:hypothetical protein